MDIFALFAAEWFLRDKCHRVELLGQSLWKTFEILIIIFMSLSKIGSADFLCH